MADVVSEPDGLPTVTPLLVGVGASARGLDAISSNERNAEGLRVNDDLTNVLNSVGIAIILLCRDSHIRRFTPAAARLLNLMPDDVGRPISDLKSNLSVPELQLLVSGVLEHLSPQERTITDAAGHYYQLTVRPYLTADRRVDGTVVVIVDTDAIQHGHVLLAEARDRKSTRLNSSHG